MNKKLISLIVSSFFTQAYSSNFNVIIERESGYDSAKLIIEETDWVNVGSDKCSYDEEVEDHYSNEVFKQEETCVQDQEKTITTKKIKSDGTTEIVDINIVQKELISVTTNNATGIHLESTCEEVLAFDSNLEDGLYKINQSGIPTVYCDMTRNGGGWMRVVNYDWYNDKSINITGFDSTINKIVKDTSGNDYKLLDGFWVNDWTTISTGSIGRWKEISVKPLYNWTKSFIEFEALAFRSLDGVTIVTNSMLTGNDNLESEYLDGFNFTYGETGSLKHLYSLPVGHNVSYESDTFKNQLSWLDESEYTYHLMATNVTNYTYNLKFNEDILMKEKESGNEKIRLRLMADQYVNDETIGFRKYIVWIK